MNLRTRGKTRPDRGHVANTAETPRDSACTHSIEQVEDGAEAHTGRLLELC